MAANPRVFVDPLHALIEALEGLHIVACTEGANISWRTVETNLLILQATVAAATLFLYDWTLILGMEVNYVWKKEKWMPLDILYLVQRYSPLVDVCFLPLYRQLGSNMTKSKCEPLLSVLGVFTLIGYLASELLLTLCVWTIWNCNKRLAIAFSVAAILLVPPASVAGGFFFSSIQYSVKPPYPGFKGCFILGSKPYVIWTWVTMGLWDFMCLILVSIPSIKFRASASHSRLRHVIYRDGLIFYVFICSSTVCNIFLNALLPPSTRVVGTSFTRCLHSLFASRALLHMREQAHDNETTMTSTIEFAPGACQLISTDFSTMNTIL